MGSSANEARSIRHTLLWTAALHLTLAVAARLAVTVLLRRCGFVALSDDDFARTTIAQSFALHPRLDPTGTSWLPVPFWVQGVVMMAAGTSLSVARATSDVLACLSVGGIYLGARAAGAAPRACLAGALAAALLPVAAFAGAATVPELPTAALCATALLLLRRHESCHPRALLFAGALLPFATLSRYESWWVAAFLVIAAIASLARRGSARVAVASVVAALTGPIAWVLWNWHAHGDPLRFHQRVSSYKKAIEGGAIAGSALWSYPKSVAWELLAIALVIAVLLVPRATRCALRSWAAPAVGALALMLGLAAAEATGGAPTHHPERALLSMLLVLVVVAADTSLTLPLPRWSPWLAATLFVPLLAWNAARQARTYGVDRREELLLGDYLAAHTAPGQRVALDAKDFGYFATSAVLGDPSRVVLTRSKDPRVKVTSDPFASADALRSVVQSQQVVLVVASHERAALLPELAWQRATSAWSVVELR